MLNYVLFFVMLAVPIALYLKVRPLLASVEVIDDQRAKCESPIELRLYIALVNNGYEVKTQVPCGPYRIDLVLPAYKIAIEADGKQWHSSPKQRAHDHRKKNAYLRKRGYKVLRFSGSRINKKLNEVITKIEKEARGLK
ncbi:MAG TPA: DUF559 domain-containing protein [Ureibacillus sp.]|uniref:endonuclease domain-containing protein n=1 Tax=Peribacillus asahii TaxID=228899 RepID=UPI002079A5CA|nr:DUF559 domain-containing protein [Peribacillus asahii]USK59197.1 DUF559 domain-containing protein [Peribacillus asahii]HWL26045.1 DUF559 domain-containing protein [Ureibacillus sp.]